MDATLTPSRRAAGAALPLVTNHGRVSLALVNAVAWIAGSTSDASGRALDYTWRMRVVTLARVAVRAALAMFVGAGCGKSLSAHTTEGGEVLLLERDATATSSSGLTWSFSTLRDWGHSPTSEPVSREHPFDIGMTTRSVEFNVAHPFFSTEHIVVHDPGLGLHAEGVVFGEMYVIAPARDAPSGPGPGPDRVTVTLYPGSPEPLSEAAAEALVRDRLASEKVSASGRPVYSDNDDGTCVVGFSLLPAEPVVAGALVGRYTRKVLRLERTRCTRPDCR